MPDSFYYEIFMKQFVQTLAQLSAAALTTTLAVPLYNFYIKQRTYTYEEVNQEEDLEEDLEEETEEENKEENVKDYSSDSSSCEEIN